MTLAVLLAASIARGENDLVAPVQLEAEPAPYPPNAHGEATVVLELEINKDGSIGEVKVRSGDPPFDVAAREAALKWKFAPAMRGGLPIRARIVAKVLFHPAQPPPPIAKAPEKKPEIAPPKPKPMEIRVVGEEREELGSTHIPKGETRLVPGAFADPFRVVEVMPGVAPVLSGLPYFFVRGSPPGDVGYFIDNIRVPILFHVGPGPSVIAPMLIERVDLFPAAYPARYGRYVGGVMAGETSAPTTSGSVARGEVQARVFDASGFVEAPFANGRGAAALGGRYSYMGAILAAVAPDYGLGYGDYQARIAYALGDRDRITLFGFGSFDRLTNEALQRTLFDTSFQRLDLRWDRTTTAGRIRVGATVGSDHILSAGESGDLGAFQTSRQARLRLELEQRIAHGVRLRAGGDLGAERFSEDRDARFSSGARTDTFGGVFLDLIARAAPAVELVPAVRVDVARSRGEDFVFVEPRFSSRVRVTNGVAWISAFGVAHQLPATAIRVPGAPPGTLELSTQEAWQASQGIEVALPAKMLAKLTLFRTRLLATRPAVQGNNYGGELFLRRDFTERLGGFLSYTLSRTERLAAGDVFTSGYDRTHVVSLVLGYNLGAGFRIGGRLYYSSGRPFRVGCPTPDCSAGDPSAPRPFVAEGRMAPFSRVDVRFEKRWTFASGSWIAGTFEWFNALLTREPEYVQWVPGGGLETFRRSALTIPSVGVEAGF